MELIKRLGVKKIFVFLLGVLTGVLLTFAIAFIVNKANSTDSGLSFFDQPGEVMDVKSFEVFQALNNGAALAWEDDTYSHDLKVLLWNKDGSPYYDNQKVKLPAGKCFRQIGIYHYSAKMGVKTVPIVTIMDK